MPSLAEAVLMSSCSKEEMAGAKPLMERRRPRGMCTGGGGRSKSSSSSFSEESEDEKS